MFSSAARRSILKPKFIHYIITRMGLGKRDELFYREHVELCRLTLAKSLEAQSNKNFIWAIAIDLRAPAWVDDSLRQLAGSIEVIVWRRDPFKTSFQPIDIKLIKPSLTYITTRADDDDFLHISFVEQTQSDLSGCRPLTALTYAKGVDLTEDGLFYKHYPFNAQGLSIVTDHTLKGHVYSCSHTNTGVIVKKNGGSVIIKDDTKPMWIRTWRLNSDSSAARGIRVNIERTANINWSEYGTNEQSIAALLLRLRVKEFPMGGVYGKETIPRLILKSYLLDKIRNLRKSNENDEEIEKLAQVMYHL
jgi:hypothetical protein